MLEIISPGSRIDFMGKAKVGITLSLLAILIGLGSIVLHGGLSLGIDFSGGMLLQIRFDKPAELAPVREVLAALEFTEGAVQHFGDTREVLIRIPHQAGGAEDIGRQMREALQKKFPGQTIELRRVEVVGPQVSSDLRRQALFAMFYAILLIVVYISGRFEGKWAAAIGLGLVLFAVTYAITQWLPGVSPAILIVTSLLITVVFCLLLQLRYALAAIVALFHDVLITIGCFSVFDMAFNLPTIAALLTIIGYSLNDTIIVFDRIRENMHGQRREQFDAVVNMSINQTLSRTILTSGTTLLVVLSLLFLGGEVIYDFAFALVVGIVVGTYSSIFIASPLLVFWNASAFAQRLSLFRPSGGGDSVRQRTRSA
jgi:preprotein translocase subunit SecF